MLVLTRTVGNGNKATSTAGEGIEEGLTEVTALEVQGDSVRLGIMAPPDTEVHRKEVYLLRKTKARQGQAKSAR